MECLYDNISVKKETQMQLQELWKSMWIIGPHEYQIFDAGLISTKTKNTNSLRCLNLGHVMLSSRDGITDPGRAMLFILQIPLKILLFHVETIKIFSCIGSPLKTGRGNWAVVEHTFNLTTWEAQTGIAL